MRLSPMKSGPIIEEEDKDKEEEKIGKPRLNEFGVMQPRNIEDVAVDMEEAYFSESIANYIEVIRSMNESDPVAESDLSISKYAVMSATRTVAFKRLTSTPVSPML